MHKRSLENPSPGARSTASSLPTPSPAVAMHSQAAVATSGVVAPAAGVQEVAAGNQVGQAVSVPLVGTVACSAAAKRRQFRALCYSLGDAFSGPPPLNWLRDELSDARSIWNLGKEFGVSFDGDEHEVVSRLADMERRDGIDNGSRPGCSSGRGNEVDQ